MIKAVKRRENIGKWDAWVKQHFKALQDQLRSHHKNAQASRLQREQAEVDLADLENEENYCISQMEKALRSPKRVDTASIPLDDK